MTRCIQCTRCVRFTEEIAGMQELGMIGRGEHMAVRTYIESTVNHELSGNVIDLCPVGALVSKPYRFSARAWEMSSVPLISPHDAVGTNLFAHVLRGQLKRVVPRENEAINEIWIADRDRFSYEGIYSEDRLQRRWCGAARSGSRVTGRVRLLRSLPAARACAAARGAGQSAATLEELYWRSVWRALKSNNVDHRLRQRDFRDSAADPLVPGLGMPVAQIDSLDALFIIGSNLRREAPLLAHRVRKAARRGAQVNFLNPARFPYLVPVHSYRVAAPADFVRELAGLLGAVAQPTGKSVPAHLGEIVGRTPVSEAQRTLAASLLAGEKRAVWLGALVARHARSRTCALAAALAALSGDSSAALPKAATGRAYLAGVLPHREAGARAVAAPG
jgi:NADH-quinone oxidoreductase subunit G